MLQACLHANLEAADRHASDSICISKIPGGAARSKGWVRMGPRAKEADLKDTKDVLSAILLADTFTQVCSAQQHICCCA
jgi:hypothetical protein